MKIVAVSDLHGHIPDVDSCDILLIGGDISPSFASTRIQKSFIETQFNPWVERVDAKHVIMIAGNHDFVFQNSKEYRYKVSCVYLEDELIEVEGIKIWGTPWQPWFHDYAFNGNKDKNEDDLREKFNKIPEGIDILLSHCPPFKIDNIGSHALDEAIERVKPKLSIFGHRHPFRSAQKEIKTWDDGRETIFVNASIVDNRRQQVYGPKVFKYDTESKKFS